MYFIIFKKDLSINKMISGNTKKSGNLDRGCHFTKKLNN